jgi:hypothetical protein
MALPCLLQHFNRKSSIVMSSYFYDIVGGIEKNGVLPLG